MFRAKEKTESNRELAPPSLLATTAQGSSNERRLWASTRREVQKERPFRMDYRETLAHPFGECHAGHRGILQLARRRGSAQ